MVIGFGGYPSLPALLAARALKIPTIIHEQNAVFGRTNRFLAGGVSAVACAFPTLMKASAKVKKALHVVGNPVRPDIQALYERQYEAPEGTLRLLVTGGSQGARLLSELVPDAMAMIPEDLRTRLRVEQQTRVESLDFARRAYREAGVEAEIAPFFRNMPIILMSQDKDGNLRYYGRKDIVDFLKTIKVEQIPWKTYHIY